MHKHVQVAELSRANWEVLNSLERIASKLLKLVAKKPVETAPRRVHSPDRALRKSVLHSAAGAEAAAEPQTFATATAATAHARALLLTRHQLALLRAVLHALHSKGIECHEKMWQVAAKRIGVNPMRLALDLARTSARSSGSGSPVSVAAAPPSPAAPNTPRTPLQPRSPEQPQAPPAPPAPPVAGGAALARRLRRAYGEAEAALEEWNPGPSPTPNPYP